MRMTVADVLVKYLATEGVEYMFGVPGTSMAPLFDACNRRGIKPVLTKHEEGAAFMADGYARVSGTLGVCFAVAGPGATNLVTGVATAYTDSVPVDVLTCQGEASAFGKGPSHGSTREGIDSVQLFAPMTKHSSVIASARQAEAQIRLALRAALEGKKGPVHLCLPKEVAEQEVDAEPDPLPIIMPRTEHVDRALAEQAAQELVQAKWPVILMGSGAVASGACDDVRELAEKLGIPVATTPRAKGAFPDGHPLALGVLGFAGSPLAEGAMKSGQMDVLMAVGTSLNQITTGSGDPRLAPAKSLIHINIDPADIGKTYRTHIPLVGDARTIVREILSDIARMQGQASEGRKERERRLAQLREETGTCLEPEKLDSPAVPLKPQRMVRELQEALPEDAVLFADVGNITAWTTHYLKLRRPQSYFCAWGMLTMGLGTAGAVGAKLAAGKRPVVALVGDGAFQMNGMEVATAVSNDIPVVWVVQNNATLGMIQQYQKSSVGDSSVGTVFKQVDLAKVAEGLGAVGYRVSKPGELKKLLPKAIASGRPTVIDCLIDPDEVPPLSNVQRDPKGSSRR